MSSTPSTLREAIAAHFSTDELRILVSDLGLNPDKIAFRERGVDVFSGEVVRALNQAGRVSDLRILCDTRRPNLGVDWLNIPVKLTEIDETSLAISLREERTRYSSIRNNSSIALLVIVVFVFAAIVVFLFLWKSKEEAQLRDLAQATVASLAERQIIVQEKIVTVIAQGGNIKILQELRQTESVLERERQNLAIFVSTLIATPLNTPLPKPVPTVEQLTVTPSPSPVPGVIATVTPISDSQSFVSQKEATISPRPTNTLNPTTTPLPTFDAGAKVEPTPNAVIPELPTWTPGPLIVPIASSTLIVMPTPIPQVIVKLTATQKPLAVATFTPTPSSLPTQSPVYIDLTNRNTVASFYHDIFSSTGEFELFQPAQIESCEPGETTPNHRLQILKRINFFRNLAGVPDIELQDELNKGAQSAAFLMFANGLLSHSPPTDWKCYGADGAQAAGRTNLALGYDSFSAISDFMKDPGTANMPVGHRRWILYASTRSMGYGYVPAMGSQRPTTALYVIDSHYGSLPIRPTRTEYVAWPPPGYIPYQVVYPRWSFSIPRADFSSAKVTMTLKNNEVNVELHPIANGYGTNTLVWKVNKKDSYENWSKPLEDEVYTVTVSNVMVAGQVSEFSYQVIVFDPDAESK